MIPTKYEEMQICFVNQQFRKTIKNKEERLYIFYIYTIAVWILELVVLLDKENTYHRGRNTRGENWMLSKGQSKESAIFSIILRQFLVIFSTPTFISEDQTVILRCWTGLNHNWFKSYDAKCNAGQKE